MNLDRLNLGCGEFYAEGWCNVDTFPGNRVDLVADITDLPVQDGTTEKVYAGHVLEHLSAPYGVLAAVREVHRVLEPGGLFLAVGPDVKRARALLKNGVITEETEDGALHGAYRWGTDVHLWPCHEDRMLELIQVVFPDAHALPIQVLPPFWPITSRAGWQCAVLARKP